MHSTCNNLLISSKFLHHASRAAKYLALISLILADSNRSGDQIQIRLVQQDKFCYCTSNTSTRSNINYCIKELSQKTFTCGRIITKPQENILHYEFYSSLNEKCFSLVTAHCSATVSLSNITCRTGTCYVEFLTDLLSQELPGFD